LWELLNRLKVNKLLERMVLAARGRIFASEVNPRTAGRAHRLACYRHHHSFNVIARPIVISPLPSTNASMFFSFTSWFFDARA